MKTYSPKASEIQREWHVVDAEGLILGRLCTEVARVLRGKHKPTFAPHLDMGDHVIIVNADKVVMSRDKAEKHMLYRHSGYPGGIRSESYAQLLARKPADAVRQSVSRHVAQGPAGPPADDQTEGVRRCRAPARRPDPEAVRHSRRGCTLNEQIEK